MGSLQPGNRLTDYELSTQSANFPSSPRDCRCRWHIRHTRQASYRSRHEAVTKLHDAVILFGITRGRPPKGMRMLIEPLQLTEPLASFNGGVVVNPDGRDGDGYC